MKKVFCCIGLNFSIALVAVLCYSPGFWGLSLSSASIFKAGMTIIMAMILLTAFVIGNKSIFFEKEEKRIVSKDDIIDVQQIVTVLTRIKVGNYRNFKEFAKTTLSQVERLQKSISRVQDEINAKFEKGSMSWDRYWSVVDSAGSISLDNIFSIVKRMQMFDESEYIKLKTTYKNDSIPDDIQEKQIALFENNMELIKSAIAANEKLILQLDTLSIELSTSEKEDNFLIDEIESLTQEVKYYVV